MATDEQLLQGVLFDPEEADFIRPPARALTYRRVETTLGLLAYAVLFSIAGLLVGILWRPMHLGWAAGAAVLPFTVWSWFRQRTGWRISGYCLGAEQIWVRGGIGHRTAVVAPYGRIQNCDVHTTVLSRWFNLAIVSVNTGARASVEIPAIDPQDAARIRSLLSDLALKRGVQL